MKDWFVQALAVCFQKRHAMYCYHERVGSYLGPSDQGADMINPGNDMSYKLTVTNDIPAVPVRPGTSGAHNASANDPEAAAAASSLVDAAVAPADPVVAAPAGAALWPTPDEDGCLQDNEI